MKSIAPRMIADAIKNIVNLTNKMSLAATYYKYIKYNLKIDNEIMLIHVNLLMMRMVDEMQFDDC